MKATDFVSGVCFSIKDIDGIWKYEHHGQWASITKVKGTAVGIDRVVSVYPSHVLVFPRTAQEFPVSTQLPYQDLEVVSITQPVQ